MIVRRVTADGQVTDDDGVAIPGFELSDGATIVDVGRTAALSALVYSLADGVVDPQPVHDQDEVYVVVAGEARAVIGDESAAVERGSILVVPADTPHRFDDQRNGFTVVAVFAPPLT